VIQLNLNMDISVVILTKNEEKNITECIKTLEGFDDIIVIDDASTDATVSIAKKLGVRLYERPMDDGFANQRNFGLEVAKGKWVLFIDADERLSSALNYEIHNQVNDSMSNYSGFYLRRIDKMWDRTLLHGESSQTRFLRLAKKSAGSWVGKVHERWILKGKVGILNHPLSHYPHPTIREFISEINYYTDLRAAELKEKNIKVRKSDIILYPFAKFIQNYFVRLGVLDGVAGLLQAIFMSFHSFLVRGKLWLMLQKIQ
jgi:glycosyltransferase involved in cell wall biosynthesis